MAMLPWSPPHQPFPSLRIFPLWVCMPAPMGGFNEGKAWTPVPQFGGWDRKGVGSANYSMVFSRARANRKQRKSVFFDRSSFGNERELIVPHHRHHHHEDGDDAPVGRRRLLRYFSCCVKVPN